MPRQFLLNLIMAALMAMVTWRVWIIAGFMVEYGDTTEFLAIPYAPITYFIAIMSGFAALTFATLAWRYLRGRGPRHTSMTWLYSRRPSVAKLRA